MTSTEPKTARDAAKTRSPLRNLLLTAGLLIALAVLFSTLSRAPVPGALEGEPAPNVPLPLVGGGELDLARHRGEVVVLDFWATWCPPCRTSMPVVDRVVEEYADRGVRLYFVNEAEPPELVEAFADKAGLTAPIALDTDGALGRAFHVTGLPFTAIVGRDGIVQRTRLGASMELEDELRADLEAALAN